MTDFSSIDLIVGPGVVTNAPVVGGDLWWWFSGPPVPVVPLPAFSRFQMAFTSPGKAAMLGRWLGKSLTGKVAKFKLGEGGWSQSEEKESITYGNGTNVVSGVVPGTPLVPGSIQFIATDLWTVEDAPVSPWNGTGVLAHLGVNYGTINYKTNSFTITRPSIIPGDVPIFILRKHRGVFTDNVSEDLSAGTGITGPYTGFVSGPRIVEGSVSVSDCRGQTLTDSGGVLSGDGTGTVNYDTGEISVTFTSAVGSDSFVRATYQGEGAPRLPSAVRSTLAAQDEAGLAVFSKTLVPNVDVVFSGVGTKKCRFTMSIGSTEAADDGTGNPPFWTEGGLFDDSDVLLLYFTFMGFRKTNGTWSKIIDLVL